MLDQYENCLFSELCLCGVDLRVDFFNAYQVSSKWHINFIIKWISLSARDQLAFWNLEISNDMSDRQGHVVMDHILYSCTNICQRFQNEIIS